MVSKNWGKEVSGEVVLIKALCLSRTERYFQCSQSGVNLRNGQKVKETLEDKQFYATVCSSLVSREHATKIKFTIALLVPTVFKSLD